MEETDRIVGVILFNIGAIVLVCAGIMVAKNIIAVFFAPVGLGFLGTGAVFLRRYARSYGERGGLSQATQGGE